MVVGIVGLSIALLGFFCMASPVAIPLGFVAVVLGWIGLSKSRRGRTMAITGLWTGGGAILTGGAVAVFWVYFIVGPMRAGMNMATTMTQSTVNAQAISSALQLYAANNANQLPPPGPGWEQALAPYVGSTAVFTSPSAAGAPVSGGSYIYVPVSDADKGSSTAVMLYENPALQAVMYSVVYADGHVEVKTKEELDAIVAALPKGAAGAGGGGK